MQNIQSILFGYIVYIYIYIIYIKYCIFIHYISEEYRLYILQYRCIHNIQCTGICLKCISVPLPWVALRFYSPPHAFGNPKMLYPPQAFRIPDSFTPPSFGIPEVFSTPSEFPIQSTSPPPPPPPPRNLFFFWPLKKMWCILNLNS